jgi:hypothetical protein
MGGMHRSVMSVRSRVVSGRTRAAGLDAQDGPPVVSREQTT